MLKSKEASLTFDFNKLRRHIVFVCIEIIIFLRQCDRPVLSGAATIARDDRTDGIIPMSPDLISPSLDFFARYHSTAVQFTIFSIFKTYNSQLLTSSSRQTNLQKIPVSHHLFCSLRKLVPAFSSPPKPSVLEDLMPKLCSSQVLPLWLDFVQSNTLLT